MRVFNRKWIAVLATLLVSDVLVARADAVPGSDIDVAPEAKRIRAILQRIRAKTSHARIILLAVFPREEKPDHPRRRQIIEINKLLAEFGQVPGITYLDLGPELLQPDGTLSRENMSDFCHPTEKGYQIWGDAIKPLLTAGDSAAGSVTPK